MKKSLFSYLFLIFLIITFLAGTYVYSTGQDFVFKTKEKTKENLTTGSDMNNGLNYISEVANEIVNKIDINEINNLKSAVIGKYQDVVNKIDINEINNLKSEVIDKYTGVINNIGTSNSKLNLPTTPYFQHTRPSSNEYVLLSTNPYDFIPNYTTVRYIPANKHSNLYIPDEIVFNVDPTSSSPTSSSPTSSSPTSSSPTSSPSGINIIQFLKNSNRNLIALGDSLTQGYIGVGIPDHPYTIKLSQNLPGINILNMGVSGNVTDQMYFRLSGKNVTLPINNPNLMPTDNTGGKKSNILKTYPFPAIVIILAGTNDLFNINAKLTTVNNIINNIQLLHTTILNESTIQKPTYTIAMTLSPANHYTEPYNANRLLVNKGIREMVNNNKGKIFLIDLENIFDQKMSSNDQYWSDFLHFSSDGYDFVGDKIYNTLSTFYI